MVCIQEIWRSLIIISEEIVQPMAFGKNARIPTAVEPMVGI
jgi:hypothetical protein